MHWLGQQSRISSGAYPICLFLVERGASGFGNLMARGKVCAPLKRQAFVKNRYKLVSIFSSKFYVDVLSNSSFVHFEQKSAFLDCCTTQGTGHYRQRLARAGRCSALNPPGRGGGGVNSLGLVSLLVGHVATRD